MSRKAEEFYTSGEYLKHNPTWGMEDSEWKVKQIFKLIPDEFLNRNFKENGIRIADIGCGAGGVVGRAVHYLRQEGYKINATGFDITEQPLRMARAQWQ